MKKSYVVGIGFLVMMVCATVPLSASPGQPSVRLPTTLVTMKAKLDAVSYFTMTLSAIPDGFDVTNGVYAGWCVQNNVKMTVNVNHTVRLYSSYDPGMPVYFQNANWSKVNYVINNKQGNKTSVQNVIWFYICHGLYPRNDSAAVAMIAAANESAGFLPHPGESLAVLIDGALEESTIQRTFFELQLPYNVTLGDLVWNDYNADGIQDAGEPGIPGVSVQLLSGINEVVSTTTTDIHGYYSFSDFTIGNYSLQFVLPQGYRFSPANQGTDDTRDSDADPVTGRTAVTLFDPSMIDMSWDAGMYEVENGKPKQHSTPNHAPTADGTAGEPYKGFVNEAIVFNGSRSYDRDGTIVSWNWSFGDGAFASGAVVTHVYTTAGRYTVLLTVTDDDGANDTYTTVASIHGPNRPPLEPQFNGPQEGHQNTVYTYSVVTTDPDNDTIQYILTWGDGSSNTSSFYRTGHMFTLTHQWHDYGFYLVDVSALDSLNASSSIVHVRIAIDVQYVGSIGYLINTDGVGPYDSFYSNQTGNITAAQLQGGSEYLIDTNGDGSFDVLFNSATGEYRAYPETLAPIYIMLLIGMVIVILLVGLVALVMRRKKEQ
jgi:hypothetical protein